MYRCCDDQCRRTQSHVRRRSTSSRRGRIGSPPRLHCPTKVSSGQHFSRRSSERRKTRRVRSGLGAHASVQPPSSRRLILLTRFRRLSTAPSCALGIYKHLRILGAAFVFSGQRLCHRQKPNWLRLCLRARLLLSVAKALSSVGLVARSPAVLIALCERQIHGNGSIGLIRAPEPNGPMIAIHQDHLRMFSVATDG